MRDITKRARVVVDLDAAAWALPLLVLVVVGAVGLHTLSFGPVVSPVGQWWTVFMALVLQAVPFLVLGSALSAVISAAVPRRLLARLPRSRLVGVPAAALAGFALPACECASVPVARSLMDKGLGRTQALVFMVASPAVNPLVLVSTYLAFPDRPGMVVARCVASVAAAVAVGWALPAVLRGVSGAGAGGAHGGHSHDYVRVASAVPGRWELFRRRFVEDFLTAAGFLTIGAFIAASLKALLPAGAQGAFARPVVAVVVMVALAVLMSVCSEADAFIAASFTGVSPVAQLVFLVVGPMVDIKLIAMQAGAFGARFTARFVPVVLVCAVAAAVVVGALL